MWFIYTMKYYSAVKKEWSNAICSNMDGPRDYPTSWSKSERERQILYDITYMWNLKNSTSELMYKTETDSDIENKLPKGDGWGGINWEYGINRCILPYIK